MTRVEGEDPGSRKVRELREEIRKSPRARALIAGRDQRFVREAHVYASWRGAHWTLAMLAEIGYPEGDESLLPMREQVLDRWLDSSFYMEFESKSAVPKHRSAEGVPIIQGRYRRCGSQQGNALYSITRLGLADKRSDGLAERLMHWQWPDGGWNCDRKPSAHVSSFNESLLPMIGLAAHAERAKDEAARAAALKASEVFLCRRLFKSRTDGKVISPHWVRPKYPRYWHYDMLGGLVAMAEMGLIKDPRCADALDLLERKELPGGGWAAQGRFYKVSPNLEYGREVRVDIDGGLGRRRKRSQERVGDGGCAVCAARGGADVGTVNTAMNLNVKTRGGFHASFGRGDPAPSDNRKMSRTTFRSQVRGERPPIDSRCPQRWISARRDFQGGGFDAGLG